MGPWVLGEELGRGAQGVVWACEHRPTGQRCAMKGFLAGRAGTLATSWRDEARAMAGLTHPGVVVVHDLGEMPGPVAEALEVPQGSPWLVMDRADGSVSDAPPSTLGEALDVCDQALRALAYVHANDLLHLDLKPANLLRFGPRVALADFGVATSFRHQRGHRVRGTPLFMAPEQIQPSDDGIGPWSDLYAMGWLLWSLVTEHPWEHLPIPSVLRAQLWDTATPPGPPALARWLQRCTAKAPADRFASAADARRALHSVRASLDPQQPIGRASSPSTAPTYAFQVVPPPPAGDASASPQPPGPGLPARIQVATPPTQRPDQSERPTRPLPQVGLGLFRLRAVPVVGRDAERDRLWGALCRAAAGGSPTVTLRGPSGLGKSHLAHWLTVLARAHGYAEAWSASGARDADALDALQLLVADGLARSVDVRADVGEHHHCVLRTIAGTTRDPVPIAPEAVTEALGRWLRATSGRRPLLLVIDDAHHALPLLHTLADVGPVPGVATVCLVQEEGIVDPAELDQALEALAAETIPVQPLPPRDRRRLVAQLLGLSGTLADALVARTDGNPLFAVQLLGDWIDRGRLRLTPAGFALVPGADLPLPDGLWDTWRTRVDGLVETDAERMALEEAAILASYAGEVRAEEWRGPLDLRERLLDARLAVVTAGGWRFVHGMLREALLRDAQDSGRAEAHHRRVAARVDDDERRGRHLFAAGARDLALAPLVRAVVAQQNRDRHRAEALLSAAEACVHDHTRSLDRVDLAIAQAGLSLMHGDRALASEQLDAVVPLAGPHPEAAARLHSRRLKLALREARLDDAQEALDAMALAAADASTAVQALEARWRAELLLARGALDEAAECLRPWLALMPSPSMAEGDAWFTWASIALSQQRFDIARDGYLRSLEAYDACGLATPRIATLGGLADAHRYLGELDEAREAASEMARVARSRDPSGVVYGTLGLAAVDLATGDLGVAAARLDALLSAGLPHDGIEAVARALQLAVAAGQGHVTTAEAALERLEALTVHATTPAFELDIWDACRRAARVLSGGHPVLARRVEAIASFQEQGRFGR